TRPCTRTHATHAVARSSTRACARCACSSPSARRPSTASTCASRTWSAFPSRGRRRCRCTREATTPRSGAAPASTARAGCRRCSRRRSSRGAWRTFAGPRPRPGETMDAHRRQRLTAVLEAEGLDALVATTTENVYYVSGLRSISHALFRGLELYAVFTRRGTALVVPFIDTTGVAADRIEVDHVA